MESNDAEYGIISEVPEQTPEELSQFRLARVLGNLGQFFTVSGIVTLLFVVYQLWGTSVQEAQAQENLREDFEERLEDFTSLTDPIRVVTPESVVEANFADAETTGSDGSDVLDSDSSDADSSDSDSADSDSSGSDSAVSTNGDSARDGSAPGTAGSPRELSSQVRELLFPPGGEDIARIKIPSINVDKIVVEGVSIDDLRKGPGRYKRSVLPGEPGNTAFAGHRTTYGAPFHNIDNLVPGDEILVTSLLGEFTYRVVGQSEKNRVGFCVEEGYRESEQEKTDARSLKGERYFDPTVQIPTTTTTTTLPPKDIPANFGIGAIDGITYFATTDIGAELERAAQVEAEAANAEEELVVQALAGVGRGAFDGIVDQPAELGHFIVSPADTCVLDDWGDNRITLTACHPKFSARQRIIVVAELVGDPAARVSPENVGGTVGDGLGADEGVEGPSSDGGDSDQANGASQSAGVSAADTGSGSGSGDGGSGDSGISDTGRSNAEPANTVSEEAGLDAGLGWDTSVLPTALMWGALTIVGYLLVQLAARRWKKWPAWLIGAVPVGFVLFLSFEQFDRLLPAY